MQISKTIDRKGVKKCFCGTSVVDKWNIVNEKIINDHIQLFKMLNDDKEIGFNKFTTPSLPV